MAENKENTKKYKRGEHPNSKKNLKPSRPGMTNNPNGHPKGVENPETIIKRVLSGIENHFEYGKIPRSELIIYALCKKALDGDLSCAKELFDRGFGKIADRVINENKEPLKIEVTTPDQKKTIEEL